MAAVQAKRAACDAVFATAELAEAILSILPEKDLFVSKRVSKQFKSAIDGSHKLQKLMHLRPTNTPRESWFVEPAEQRGENRMTVYRSARASWVPGVIRTPVTLNPHLLTKQFPHHPFAGAFRAIPYPRYRFHLNDYIMRYYRDLYLRNNTTGSRSSLEETYLSDPPCRKAGVSIHVSYKVPGGSVWISMVKRMVEVESGLKVKDMLTALFSDRNVSRVEQRSNKDGPSVPDTTGDRSDLFDNATLGEVISELNTDKSHQKGIEDGRMGVWIMLEDVVVPTAEQRELVRSENKMIEDEGEEDDPGA